MHRIGRSLLAVALAMLWLVPAAFAQGAPALKIVSPTAGQKVTSTDIPVTVKPVNFTFSCANVGRPDKAGEGHVHAMLDGMSMAALTNFYCTDSFTISGQGLKPGQHTLILDLATNTHMDLEDTVQKVTFDYAPTTAPAPLPAPANTGTPTVTISGLSEGQTVGPKFSITAATTNFHPSADLEGKQDVPGFGHIHVFVDMAPPSGGMMSLAGMVGMPGSNQISLDLSAWPSGKHTLTVELVNNDHTPIMEAKPAMVTFNLNNPAVPATLPKTGGNPYALPGALLVSVVLIGAGAGLRRFRRPHRRD